MREIKFRGWGKQSWLAEDSDKFKMTYYPEWFTLHDQTVLCFEAPPHSYVDESDIDYPNRIELMQFTGLYDKNGKEIYEGDIVTCPWHWTEPHVIELPTDYYAFAEHQVGQDLTVIGNIYENPEVVQPPLTNVQTTT